MGRSIQHHCALKQNRSKAALLQPLSNRKRYPTAMIWSSQNDALKRANIAARFKIWGTIDEIQRC